MASSLSKASSLSNRLSLLKECETCRIKYKNCECFLEYTNFKGNLIKHKCFCCNKNYQIKCDENLKKRFFNTYKFSNCDIKKGYFINIWMIEKNSMKFNYLKKKIFTVTLT